MATITFTVVTSDLPSHTPEQFKEWIAYRIGHRYDMDNDNPLADKDLFCATMSIRHDS